MTIESTQDAPTPGDERVGEILQAWLARREQGIAEDSEQLVASNPDVAQRLRQCIETVEMLGSSGLDVESVPANHFPSIPDFEISGELGRGGMGIVYEANQLSLDRTVALKILPRTSADPLAAQRFQREAETAAALNHAHIVPIHAVGQHDGVHWYAMQRIDGKPLTSLLQTRPIGIDADEVARIGIEAAEALAHAHHQGVVHRDIKPGNLLIESSGHVWLADFGLARREVDASATVTGAMVGTPRYMSPEQVFAPRGVIVDQRSDIYSLGATLYELATGTALFDGSTPLDVLQQIRTAEPVNPSSIRSTIPRDLEVVLQKCLAKEPKDRYQTAQELASDLRAIREGQPIKARGVPLWALAMRRLMQNASTVRLAVSMIVTTVAVLACSMVLFNLHRESKLGFLHISSSGGPYVADIYAGDDDDHSDKPIATITVPMQQPIRLKTGQYRVRMAAEGKHSQLAKFDIAATELTKARYVDTNERFNGIPIDEELPVLIRASDGSDLFALLGENQLIIHGPYERVLLEIDVNQIDASDATNSQKAPVFGRDLFDRWSGIRESLDPYYAKPRRIMESAIDLNADGEDDFVITARRQASIAAISSSGETLWNTTISLPKRRPANAPLKPAPVDEYPSVFEVIPTEDIDGDGTRDLVVNLVRAGTRDFIEPFIATVNGRTGETIALAVPPVFLPVATNKGRMQWPTEGTLVSTHRHKNPREFQSLDNTGASLHRAALTSEHPLFFANARFGIDLPVTPPLHLTRLNEQAVAVMTTYKTITAWNVRTGKQVGETTTLPFTIAARPTSVTLGPNTPPAFLVWAADSVNTPNRRSLAIVVLGEPEPRWVKNVHFHWEIAARGFQRTDLPLVEDLDGDGADELLVPISDQTHWNHDSRLICLDSTTGNPKWKRPFAADSVELAVERASVMRDFDGDGIRDIAVVTLCGRKTAKVPWGVPANDGKSREHFAIFVDLVSGADASFLRCSHAPISTPDDQIHAADIDRLCSDGDAQLEVSAVVGRLDEDEMQATTIRFNLAESEPPIISRGLSRLAFADSSLDSGFYYRRTGIDEFYENRVFWLNRELNIIRHIDANRLITNWTTTDGRARLLVEHIATDRISAVDTESGQTIWTQPFPEHAQIGSTPVQDNNGNAAQILLQTFRHNDRTIALIDAKTGRFKWELPVSLGRIEKAYLVGEQNNPSIQIFAHASYFARHQQTKLRGMRLIQVSLKQGTVQWKSEVLHAMDPTRFDGNESIAFHRIDCDNDGIVDAIAADDGEPGSLALTALSGVDGQVMWQEKLSLPVSEWPVDVDWPAVAVAGPPGDQRIIVLDGSEKDSFELRMLNASNGKEIDRRVLPMNKIIGNKNWRSQFGYWARNHQFALHVLGVEHKWPTLLVNYPSRDAGTNKKAWLRIATSADGFIETQPSLQFERQRPFNGLFTANDEVFELKAGKLFRESGEAIKGDSQAIKWRSVDRVFQLTGPSAMAKMTGQDGFEAIVDLGDGRIAWRKDTGEKERSRQPLSPKTPLIQRTSDSAQLVRVTRHGMQTVGITKSRSPLTTTPKFAASLRHADPRLVLPLPTSPLWGGQTAAKKLGDLITALVVTIFALWLPSYYLYRMFRNRRYNLSYLMLAPPVAMAALFAWRYLLQPGFALHGPSTFDDSWLMILFYGSFALAVLIMLLKLYLQRSYWVLLMIAACTIGLTVFAIGVPIATQAISDSPQRYQWGVEDLIAVLGNSLFTVAILGGPLWVALMYVKKSQAAAEDALASARREF